MPYRLSALVEQDLDEIWSYVAEDASTETADRLIVIYYRYEGDVLVARVLHGRRDQSAAWSE